MRDADYEKRIAAQIEQYAETIDMHALPQSCRLMGAKHNAPAIREVFGAQDGKGPAIYVEAFREAAAGVAGQKRILSIGCGDGKIEIDFAKKLIAMGETHFTLVAADLSPFQLGRFAEDLQKSGLERYFALVECDLNDLAPVMAIGGSFDVVIAHHSLHHIVELEKLFDFVFDALKETGIFATCDMIGRNGHRRWPEAAAFVRTFWPLLAPKQRYHVLLKRFEDQFLDWDCSQEGFEGIRAEDILPLMVKKFHARKFLAIGGFMDPFLDRGFGHGFDMENEHDRNLVECIAGINEILLDAGVVKPTQMLAHFGKRPCQERFYRTRSSQFCLRVAEPDWVRFHPEARDVEAVETPRAAEGGAKAPAKPGPGPEKSAEKTRLMKRLRGKLREQRSRGLALLQRAISAAYAFGPSRR